MRSPLLLLLLWLIPLASSTGLSMEDESPAVHIVYTEKPEVDDHESVHIRTLSAVLGSEEKAKDSLVYVYKHAASGFSAKLTPDQVAQLSEQPGVIRVIPNRQHQLHTAPGRLH